MCQSEQDRCGEFVVQETALDVAAFGDYRARIHGDDITGLDAERERAFSGIHILIQQNLHMLLDLLHFLICNMGGWFCVQDNAGIHFAVAGVDRTVFPVCGGPLMSAKGCRAKTSVLFDGAHHSAQRIYMGSQHERRSGSSQCDKNISLSGTLRSKAKSGQFG